MRQKNETASSFNELKEITQAIHALKNSAQTNANAKASEPTQEKSLKRKTTTSAKKKGGLNPTKKAFSERQITTIRDKAKVYDNARLEAIQKQANNTNANAFKSDEAQENKKGASDEA
ncbi:hypothetical protein ACQJ8C_05450 [Helicobacter pylori]